ncbi:hypothetical protein ACRFAH_18960, partial [Klebsiella pneumoniae]
LINESAWEEMTCLFALSLGHAFQNNWLFVALFIVFVAALAWFVNGKSAKPKGESVHESV